MKTAPLKKPVRTKVHHGPTTVHVTHWVLFWSLVLCTLVVINASFAQYQKPLTEAEMNADSIFTIADSLEQQADMLDEQADAIHNAQTDLPSTRTSDACSRDKSPAETYVKYVDDTSSVSVSVPYSFSWNSQDCQLAPVESGQLYFEFGPGDFAVRDATFRILPATSTASVMAQVKAKEAVGKTNGMDTVTNIRQRTVSGLSVISYSVDAAIGYVQGNWIAVGRNYVYEIQSTGWLTDAEAIKIIQSLRVTK